MEIFVPESLEDIKPQLKTFFDAMIHKLDVNAHKGHWENLDLDKALLRLKDEVTELEEAINEGNAIRVTLETADVANFALMACDIAIKNGRKVPKYEINIHESNAGIKPGETGLIMPNSLNLPKGVIDDVF